MRRERGFTYLFVLFFVAITGAAVAALGHAWSNAMQSERERELEFRGGEIARAIWSYKNAGARQQLPASFDDLIEDRRAWPHRYHLRRAYSDPFTGKADWVLISEPAQPGRFKGVHSRSEQALLRQMTPDGQKVVKASDWKFGS
jgi:type II secretory pathway pseudopilin PulG